MRTDWCCQRWGVDKMGGGGPKAQSSSYNNVRPEDVTHRIVTTVLDTVLDI